MVSFASAKQHFASGNTSAGYAYLTDAALSTVAAGLNAVGIFAFLKFPPSLVSGGLSVGFTASAGGVAGLSIAWAQIVINNPALSQVIVTEIAPALVSAGIVYFAQGTPSDAYNKVRRGQGPKGIQRIDRPNNTPHSQWEAHKGGQGSPAVKLDGTVKHGTYKDFPKKALRWLADHGWAIPEEWL